MNSREKGKRGEREWAKFLTDRGYPARRGQQYNGLDGHDVVAEGMEDYHAEVKRVERLNIDMSMQQAIMDADGLTPYVAHRRNGGGWLVTMRAEDWVALVRGNTDG